MDCSDKTIGDKKQDDYPAGGICYLNLNLKARLSSYHWTRVPMYRESVFLNELNAAEGVLMRAAASIQPFDTFV